MKTFLEYLEKIKNKDKRKKLEEILVWIKESYPELDEKIAWNQPMFVLKDTFIIGFSVSKNHISIAPEKLALSKFSNEILEAGYTYSKEIFRIMWSDNIDYRLLKNIIDYNYRR